MATTSRIRAASARIWAASPRGQSFVAAARVAAPADPARHRAESHVRVASTILGGTMCWRTGRSANSRSTSTFAGPAHEPFRVHICTLAHAYGESLEKGELELESRAAGRASSTSTTAGRWPRLVGHCCSAADGSECFAELERLQRCSRPDDAERSATGGDAERAEAMLERGARVGRLEAAVDATRGEPRRWMRCCGGNFSRSTAGSSPASSPITGASST